jgi:hypothetical protein
MRSVIIFTQQCFGFVNMVFGSSLTTYTVLFLQVNPDMVPAFEKAGLQFVGKDETGKRMEV